MNRDNRTIKKMMATAAVLLASFAIIVLVMYGGMETSKASSIEKVYATYTNPLNNKTIKVSKKSAYGKATRSGNYQENIVIANNTFDTTLGDTLRLAKYKNVKITDKQYERLKDNFGTELLHNQILALDNYIVNGKGNKYKDHYRVLNTWCNNNKVSDKTNINTVAAYEEFKFDF